MSEKKKINYFGSAYHNDYQGKFTGYSLVVSLTQLEDAKEFAGPDGRVKITIRPGIQDPMKPYASIAPHTPKQEGQSQNAQYSKPQAQKSDLPF
jgi:hypothetical protein